MKPLKTYLVEDSLVIRENLTATLEEMVPLRVVGAAEDEPTAVSWLGNAENRCDLAVVDIFLRRGSGFGVLEAARRAGRSCALVVLTNYATPDIRRRCLSLGADRVFDKSDEIDGLIDFCTQLARAAPAGEGAPAPS
jgi:DNA-binding NarL/FixJ family response regulator